MSSLVAGKRHRHSILVEASTASQRQFPLSSATLRGEVVDHTLAATEQSDDRDSDAAPEFPEAVGIAYEMWFRAQC